MTLRIRSIVWLTFLGWSWATVNAETFFLLRARKDNVRYRNLADNNVVTSVEKAQAILSHYGYLSCGVSSKKSEVPRRCSEEEFSTAVRQYQATYNMKETGVLDDETLRVMSEARCGNKDGHLPLGKLKIKNRLNTNHVNQPGKKRRGKGKKQKKQRIKRQVSLQTESPSATVVPDGTAEISPPPPAGDTFSRRRRWLDRYQESQRSGKLSPMLDSVYEEVQRRRIKRNVAEGQEKSYSTSFPNSQTVTWRLVNSAYSNQLTAQDQRTALTLAFRMWSEVVPVVFYEDITSKVDDVDVLIAFGKGEHMNCPDHFDGFGGQLGHALRGPHNSGAEIHVDDDEHLTMASEHGTNLVKVAVHEVGHALGLQHVSLNTSIMYAIYSKALPNTNFELGPDDREAVQTIYGVCKGKFDTVFDWVRPRPDGQMIYNTYFFRGRFYWMYENRFNRTRYGDPLPIAPEWKGLPNDVNAYVHIWKQDYDVVLFFKGKHYWRYNNTGDAVLPGYPRNISDDFRPMPNSTFPAIPNRIDAAFFDKRDANLYFFKGNLVYAYNISMGHEGCCLPGYPKELNAEFPPYRGRQDGSPLPAHLDAVYYSYTDQAMYFFKGPLYWHNVAFNPTDKRRPNTVKGPYEISSKWHDICDVEL